MFDTLLSRLVLGISFPTRYFLGKLSKYVTISKKQNEKNLEETSG